MCSKCSFKLLSLDADDNEPKVSVVVHSAPDLPFSVIKGVEHFFLYLLQFLCLLCLIHPLYSRPMLYLLIVISFFTHVCMYVLFYVQMHVLYVYPCTCVCECGGKRTTLGVILRRVIPLPHLSHRLKAQQLWKARWPGASETHASLSLQGWN